MTFTLSIEITEDVNWLGGGIYADNLLASLSALPSTAHPRVQLRFLTSPNTILANRISKHSVVSVECQGGLTGDLMAFARRLHRAVVRRWPWLCCLSSASRNDLYFPVFDTAQQWRRNLYWIPDFQPHYLPELFDATEISSRLQSFRDIARSRGILLLSSHAALTDFRKFYPDATIEPRVWSFCSSIEAGSVEVCHETLARYGLPEKFLYIANQFWRHKDHATAFNALRLLRERGMEISVVCTGLQYDRRDPAYFEMLKNELIQQELDHHVHFLGVVPRADQIQFFRAAAAVLQPSRFEGWSTVIEDAKALGRPIIASDIAVHREQLSEVDNTYLFRTSDAADLADRIAMIWPNLPKGPDPNLELLAAERRDVKRLDAAHRFVAIVEETLAYPQQAGSKNRKRL